MVTCKKPDLSDNHTFNTSSISTSLSATDSLVTTTPHTKAGVESLLLKAYTFLDGTYPTQPGATWQSGTDNWIFGSVAGGEAHKGSTPDDQYEASTIEAYNTNSANSYFSIKWQVNMTALRYTNAVISTLLLVTDGSISTAQYTQILAEAEFLRGFYEFELAKLWRNVPYIAQGVTYKNGYNTVKNPGPIWANIESNFAYAFYNLPATQPVIGRPNKFAAEAFLAKVFMFDHNYTRARTYLANLITSGVTSAGLKYKLVNYADNFNPSKKANAESVFLIRAVVNDGSQGYDGNSGDILNFPSAGPATCCGFFTPSFSFVNAFRTSAATGLPALDGYNNVDLKNDQGVAANSAFVPATDPLDSRLDWSVGRRGIPYLDWGVMPGASWARDQPDAGPYVNIKSVYYKAAQASTSEAFGGWASNQSTSNGYNAIRFADILLMAAEAEIEVGSLETAEKYVNIVRARAADKAGWVYKYKNDSNPALGYSTTPAANYKVGLYGVAGGYASTGFAVEGQAYARKAVYFERMLELGMEGHRFFDLQRWDGRFGGPAGSGFMAQTLNSYLKHESHIANFPDILQHSAVFTAGKNEIYPIPADMIKNSKGYLTQNPGY
ncbi:RagB/SusD family nutrient uptake outer membrane protein [Mucilaginibacter sp.]|uniref:RagB/SusD family nutrient uptake outer membrane protein n=1 Tax=Mucilaginibacter sp. TaxID=1882438 RepID=UPI00374DB0C7